MLHTLRYLIGDDAFFRSLRKMAYPTPAMERMTDGRQTRLVDTEDFRRIAEAESKMKLDWFFEVYLRQPKLPKLVANIKQQGRLTLRWETPNNMPFPMPVEVMVNGKPQRVEMKNGEGVVTYTGEAPSIDPKGWVLRAQ